MKKPLYFPPATFCGANVNSAKQIIKDEEFCYNSVYGRIKVIGTVSTLDLKQTPNRDLTASKVVFDNSYFFLRSKHELRAIYPPSTSDVNYIAKRKNIR